MSPEQSKVTWSFLKPLEEGKDMKLKSNMILMEKEEQKIQSIWRIRIKRRKSKIIFKRILLMDTYVNTPFKGKILMIPKERTICKRRKIVRSSISEKGFRDLRRK